MAQATTRIGLIGYGQIGRVVHEMIDKDPNNGMEVVFVHDMVSENLAQLPGELALNELGEFASRKADLVVEMAHPTVTREWGKRILEKTNYMLISVTALADPEMEQMLEETTQKFGTRGLYSSWWRGRHGCTTRKPGRVGRSSRCNEKGHPRTWIALPPEWIQIASLVRRCCMMVRHEVSVPSFPAIPIPWRRLLMRVSDLRKTRSTLVVNPDWNTATVAVHAKGEGVEMSIERVESITGVTGASTPASIFNSVQMIGSAGPGIHLR